MSYDRFENTAASQTGARTVDAGLQDYMRSVYNTMTLGLGLTGLVAAALANIPAVKGILFGNPLLNMIVAFAPLLYMLVAFRGANLMRLNSGELRTRFYLFSIMMGASFAGIFMMFSGASIARAFFVTAAAFAGTSLYGYTTKKDLTGMGAFLFMGVFGILIAMVVNMFLQSAALHFIVSIVGILVFTGLTAFETQRLKETYAYGRQADEANAKVAVMGALSLYINFINMFQFILSFMGSRE
ncbi:MAG: Bax inhibitor-1/YccA family protein [Alphaproteobacteria bacterium]|nr:Bax inhibitor-1/YccA family protein [Alphaproteobacteria bacterium]